eukprot:1690822-Rhodomonas_salina.2
MRVLPGTEKGYAATRRRAEESYEDLCIFSAKVLCCQRSNQMPAPRSPYSLYQQGVVLSLIPQWSDGMHGRCYCCRGCTRLRAFAIRAHSVTHGHTLGIAKLTAYNEADRVSRSWPRITKLTAYREADRLTAYLEADGVWGSGKRRVCVWNWAAGAEHVTAPAAPGPDSKSDSLTCPEQPCHWHAQAQQLERAPERVSAAARLRLPRAPAAAATLCPILLRARLHQALLPRPPSQDAAEDISARARLFTWSIALAAELHRYKLLAAPSVDDE